MKNIKNIIFDLGGVILNIDYELTSIAFEKLGVINFNGLYPQNNQNKIFNSFEKGEISADDFRSYIKRNSKNILSDNEINKAWNAMLLDLPLFRYKFILSLKKDFNIYLLSNTNAIHITAFKNIINKSITYKNFEALFKKIYLSSEMGMRKPNEDCFKYVIKENSLNSKETLFIDDSVQHIIGANNVGLKTHHLQANEDIIFVIPDIIQ